MYYWISLVLEKTTLEFKYWCTCWRVQIRSFRRRPFVKEYFNRIHENSKYQLYPNVDGIRFLTQNGGCGGSTFDSITLCNLLAGYINNPNVAGATILSLGCQHA